MSLIAPYLTTMQALSALMVYVALQNDNSGEKAGAVTVSKSTVMNVKEEAEEEQEGGMAADALPDLPESLGDDLGDASSLQADPDALLHDSMQASDSTPAQAAADQPANAASAVLPSSMHASDSTAAQGNAEFKLEAGGQQGIAHSEVTEQLLGIIAGALDKHTAASIVARAHGDLAAAINLFYDEGTRLHPENSQQPSSSAESVHPTGSNESAGSAAASLRANAGNGSVSKASKQTNQPPVSRQKSKGSKRGASNADSSQTNGAVKKAKATVQTGQRSIAAFFAGQAACKHSDVKSEAEEAKTQLQHMQRPPVERATDTAVKADLQDMQQVVDLTSSDDILTAVKQEPDTDGDTPMPAAKSGVAAHLTSAKDASIKTENLSVMMKEAPSDPNHPMKVELEEHHSKAQTDISDAQAIADSSRQGIVTKDRPMDVKTSDRSLASPDQAQTQPLHPFFGARRSKPGAPASEPPKSPAVPSLQAGPQTEAPVDPSEQPKPAFAKAHGSKVDCTFKHTLRFCMRACSGMFRFYCAHTASFCSLHDLLQRPCMDKHSWSCVAQSCP